MLSSGLPRDTGRTSSGLDLRQPILSGGYTSQIFLYVLLSDVTYRDLRAFAVRDDDIEDALTCRMLK
jgi:hypothetical protein